MSRSDRLYDHTNRLLNENQNHQLYENIDTSDILEESETEDRHLSLKKKALELLILIMLNINEEYIE